MIIVRRKVDGLYFNGARSNARPRRGPENWVSDIQLCLPYKNKRGAQKALGGSCYLRIAVEGSKWPRWEYHPELFDEKYDIVPVKLALETS